MEVEKENRDEQLEIFDTGAADSLKIKKAMADLEIAEAKALKLNTDNALRCRELIYAKTAEDSYRKMFNIIYGTLQVLMSETLPFEFICYKTTGEMREGFVRLYTEIITKGHAAFEEYLNSDYRLVNDIFTIHHKSFSQFLQYDPILFLVAYQ